VTWNAKLLDAGMSLGFQETRGVLVREGDLSRPPSGAAWNWRYFLVVVHGHWIPLASFRKEPRFADQFQGLNGPCTTETAIHVWQDQVAQPDR
jgi:hypothetical protein